MPWRTASEDADLSRKRRLVQDLTKAVAIVVSCSKSFGTRSMTVKLDFLGYTHRFEFRVRHTWGTVCHHDAERSRAILCVHCSREGEAVKISLMMATVLGSLLTRFSIICGVCSTLVPNTSPYSWRTLRSASACLESAYALADGGARGVLTGKLECLDLIDGGSLEGIIDAYRFVLDTSFQVTCVET